jgi:uncharacterized membrane protein
MKNKIISNKIYLSLALLLILGISFVSAFSVSAPYMENKELNLTLGSTITDLQYVLQNGGGATEDINVKVAILNGSDIATITDSSDTYKVSPGQQIPVNLRITLPADVQAGNTYDIRLSFVTVAAGQSGEFGFGTGQQQNFKVVVIKPTPLSTNNGIKTFLYIIIAVLAVLIIIVLVLIKRKNRSK